MLLVGRGAPGNNGGNTRHVLDHLRKHPGRGRGGVYLQSQDLGELRLRPGQTPLSHKPNSLSLILKIHIRVEGQD